MADAMTNSGSFAAVSSIVEAGPRRFSAAVDPGWTIGGKPNGGYLLAMLGRAAAASVTHEHPIAASAHYLQAPDPGRVEIQTAVLRAGRSASQVRATMFQGGAACVEAVITVSHLEPETRPYWSAGVPAPGRVGFEDCQRLIPQTPDGTRVAIMEQLDLRLEPESLAFAQGQPRGLGELRGWLELSEHEPFDAVSLLFAVDALPPATFDIEYSGWVPTLELTVYIRALPVPGPVRILQRAGQIEARRVDETCWVWDQNGHAVAHGTQLAGIRLG
jgi:acyl-coenzyme A thioesterase PaaI-like protein